MPQKRVIKAVIVGGGISGIAQAVRLKEALGDKIDFTVYERAAAAGGVWLDSTWPGAGVDVAIHLYQLYSELNPNWSKKYAERDEVLAYWNGIIDKHNLRERFVFGHEFVSSSWDERTQKHTIHFSRASPQPPLIVEADILISATGALNKPIIPLLPGIESFEGKQWHSSRWENDVDLRNKKVAVIGNGSSGIQVVPNIVELEGIQLTQFIRSPGFFTPKVNSDYSPFQRWAFKWIPGLRRAYRGYLFYLHDYFALAKGLGTWSAGLRQFQMGNLIAYLHKTAPKEYHDILTPKFPLHCKRTAYNAGWLESLHRPNVTLSAVPITAVSPKGLITKDGVEHEFDVIVWATGFDVSRTGVGLNYGVKGLGGVELSDVWEKNEGAEAYYAVATPQVPNYFIVLGPNAISGYWSFTIGNQSELIARLIRGMYDRGLTSIVPRPEAHKVYNEALQKRLNKTVLISSSCAAWYKWKNLNTGKVIAPSGLVSAELYLRTRVVHWEDWLGRRFDADGKAVEVPVKSPSVWNPFVHLLRAAQRAGERYFEKLQVQVD